MHTPLRRSSPLLAVAAATTLGCQVFAHAPRLLSDDGAKEKEGAKDKAPTLFVTAKRVIVRPGEELENAAVIVRDGRIVAVGKDLTKPADAQEITGEVVCASFFDVWGALGMAADALQDPGTSPATRGSDGYDLTSAEALRKETLRAGITGVRVQAGVNSRTSGLGALVRIAPTFRVTEALIARDASVTMNIGLSANAQSGGPSFEIVDGQVVVNQSQNRGMDPFDRLADLDRVASAIEAGKSYQLSRTEWRHDLEDWQKKIAEKETELEKDAKKAKKDREKEEKDAKEKGKTFAEKKYKEDKKPQAPRYDEDNEVLARIANGDLPLIVQAHRAGELRGLLASTKSFDRLRLIVAGGSEARTCAKELAERHVPVIVWPALRGRNAPDEYDGSDLALAGDLSRAGVTVLLGTGGADPAASRDLPLLAALCIGHGLERNKAFEALTLGAASAFDLGSRLGSVERGKDAELLVLDGEPLGGATHVRYVISNGRVVATPES